VARRREVGWAWEGLDSRLRGIVCCAWFWPIFYTPQRSHVCRGGQVPFSYFILFYLSTVRSLACYSPQDSSTCPPRYAENIKVRGCFHRCCALAVLGILQSSRHCVPSPSIRRSHGHQRPDDCLQDMDMGVRSAAESSTMPWQHMSLTQLA